MRTVVVGRPLMRHEELFEAGAEALKAVEEAMRPGQTFGDVFDAHARVMEAHDSCATARRLRLFGGRALRPLLDGPADVRLGQCEPIRPNMTLFAHMIIMDSDSNTAMCLGQTYLTTDGAPECLSRLLRSSSRRRVEAVALNRAAPFPQRNLNLS